MRKVTFNLDLSDLIGFTQYKLEALGFNEVTYKRGSICSIIWIYKSPDYIIYHRDYNPHYTDNTAYVLKNDGETINLDNSIYVISGHQCFENAIKYIEDLKA